MRHLSLPRLWRSLAFLPVPGEFVLGMRRGVRHSQLITCFAPISHVLSMNCIEDETYAWAASLYGTGRGPMHNQGSAPVRSLFGAEREEDAGACDAQPTTSESTGMSMFAAVAGLRQ